MAISGTSFPSLPSVFISSTVRDLHDLRTAVAYNLRSQGFIVNLSEDPDFDVRGDRPAIDECLENVRASDFYLLLIGGRRGGLYRDESISVTRKEYRVAREQFLTTGKPRQFLFLREQVESALSSSEEAQIESGIDDPDHLMSFIAEAENPHVPNAPNYLTRFRDFSDLMNSLTGKLNIGKNVRETLIRHTLVAELSGNLARMSMRLRHAAYPIHGNMTTVVQQLNLSPTNLSGTVEISAEQRTRLTLAMPGIVRGADIVMDVTREAVNQGIFLEFNPSNGSFEESTIHRELANSLEYVSQLGRLDEPFDSTGWAGRLSLQLSSPPHSGPCSVQHHDLAMAFGYYNRVSNVYNSHLALCKVFLGVAEEVPSYEHRPLTGYGDDEEHNIRRKQVSALEVQQLITNDVFPLGSRPMADLLGEDRGEQVQRLIQEMQSNFGDLPEEHLRRAAENLLDSYLASPAEGIDELRPPNGQ